MSARPSAPPAPGFKATRASPLPAPSVGTGADYAAAVPDYRTPAQAPVTTSAAVGGTSDWRQRYPDGSLAPEQFGAQGQATGVAASICGPVAAVAFARATGRDPTIAEALDIARKNGRWKGEMQGPASEAGLLTDMGIPNRLDPNPSAESVIRDVQTGNPVIVSSSGHYHYFVITGYDPSTGLFDTGNTGVIFKDPAQNRRWRSWDDLSAQAALFIDEPTSPTPSTAADMSPQQGMPGAANATDQNPYGQMARDAATAHGVPPDLLRAQLYWESGGFDPDVIGGTRTSSAGAVGLGQFMPATAKAYGVDPTDPRSSADGAARYMADLYAQYGDWDLALIAYNGGDGAVRAYRSGQPYAETRAYLANVHRLQASGGGGDATTPGGIPAGSGSSSGGSRSPFAPAEQPYAAATAYDPNTDPTLNPFGQFLPDPIGLARQGARTASGAIGGASDFLRGGSTTPETPESQGWTAGSPNQPDLAPRADVLASLGSAPPIPGSPDWIGHQALEALDRPNRAVRVATEERITNNSGVGDTLAAAGQGFRGERDASYQAMIERANPALAQKIPDATLRLFLTSIPGGPPLADAISQMGGITYSQAMGAAATVTADPLNALEVLGLAGRGVRLAGTEGVDAVRALGRLAERVAPEIADRALLAGGQGVRDMGALGLAPDVAGEARAAIKARQAFPDVEAQFEQQAADALGRRMYHGTGAAFDTPDAARFDSGGLFGPGYYITTDPVVASDYAYNRALPAAMSTDETALQKLLDQWMALPESQRSGARTLEEIQKIRDAIEARKNVPYGPNVRAVDVPEGLRLLDADAPLRTQPELLGQVEQALGDPTRVSRFQNAMRSVAARERAGPMMLSDVQDGLALAFDGNKGDANRVLQAVGYDGIRYAGGKRIPMADAAGNAIEHTAVVIFPESLPKIRNAISGTAMGRAADRGESIPRPRRNVVRPAGQQPQPEVAPPAEPVTSGMDATHRSVERPAVTFRQWAEARGVQPSQLASDYDLANVIGGVFTESTRAGRGKVTTLMRKVDFTQRLQAEYDQAVRSGEIATVRETVPLGESAADMAYRRVTARRAERLAAMQPQLEAAPLFDETRAPTFGGRQLTPADAGGGSAEFPILDAQGAAARAEQAAQGPGLFGAEFAPPPSGPRQVSLGEAPPIEPPATLPTATGGTPDPLVGNAVKVASPADPTVAYDARYRVVPLDDLTTSHTDAFTPTAGYPAEMQPRLRDRAGAQLQVQHIASTLDPDSLLANAGRTDAGPPIVGPDLMVESGNGRTLALRLARDQFPDRWAAYQDRLAQRAAEMGVDPAAVRGVRDPVLVLERQTPVDRAAFAAEANASPTLAMGPFEQALQDARRIPSDVLAAVDVPAGSNIEAALRGPKALPLVKALMARFPANERAALMDADGSLNAAGLTRIKNALFAAVYPGEAGKRLTQAFVESLDPTLKNVETGLFASLPAMARAEGLIRTGARDASMSLSGDLAAAVDVLARLRQQGVRVADYVGQQSIFERELTPTQEQLLVHLDSLARNPRRVREFVTRYADAVETQAHSDQAGLFGAVEPADKGALLERASHGAIEADAIGDGPAAGAAAPAAPAAAPDAAGTGLEEPPAGTGGPQAARPDPAAAPGRVGPTLSTEPIVPAGLRRARPVPSQRVLPDMPAAGIPTRPATRAGFAGRLNVSKFPPAIQDALRAAYESDPQAFEAASRGVIPDAEVARMATEVDIAPLMEKWAPGTIWNAEEITAARTVVARTFADVAKAARGADSTEGNAAFAEAVRRAQSISGAGSELGRGLRSLRGTVEADALLNWREAARGGVEDAFARVNGVHDDIEAVLRDLPEEELVRAQAALNDAKAAADDGYQAARNGVADHPTEAAPQPRVEGQQAVPPPEAAPNPASAVDANGKPLTRAQQTALEREKIRQEFALARYGKRLEELTAREKTIVDGATAREAMRQERIGQSERLSADYKAQLEQQTQAAKDARTAYSERIKLEREREAAAQSTRAAAERGRIAGQQAHERALRAAEDRHAQAMVKLFDAITDPARRNNVRALVNTLGGRNGTLTPWQQAAQSIRVAQRGRSIKPDQQQRLYKALIRAVTGTDDQTVQSQRITQLRRIVQRNDAVAMGRLLQEANQPGFWDNLMAYRSAGLLTGPATHVRNIVGNSVSLASSPAERALAMPIDVARATVTGTPRERFMGEIPRELAGWHHAFPEAWSRFTAIMRYGFDPADLEGLANVRGESTIPIAKYPINTVFRGLGGMDAFFRHLSSQGEIRALAYRQARMEGLQGDALIRRTADLIDVPSVKIIEQAQKTARYRTFRQEMEGLGKGLNDLAREAPPFRLVMPFISTPYNIIKYDLERSPLGALSILADLKRGYYNPASKRVIEHPEQLKEMGDLSDRIARLVIGATVLYGASTLYASGELTGNGPPDPGERDLWLRDHQPNSVKIGGVWVSWQNIPGVSTNLGVITGVMDTQQYGKGDAGQQALGGVQGAIRAITQRSFLSGMADLAAAIAPGGGAITMGQRYLINMGASFLPASALLRRTAQGLDPEVKQPIGLAEQFTQNIPGLSRTVQPKINRSAHPITRDTRLAGLDFPGSALAGSLLNPALIDIPENDPMVAEAARTGVALPVAGTKVAGQDLTPEQQRRYAVVLGERANAYRTQVYASDLYATANEATKQALAEKANNEARTDARDQVMAELGIPPARRQGEPDLYDMAQVLPALERFWTPEQAQQYREHPYLLEVDIRRAQRVFTDYMRSRGTTAKPTEGEFILAKLGQTKFRSPAWRLWSRDVGRSLEQSTTDDFFNRMDAQVAEPVAVAP